MSAVRMELKGGERFKAQLQKLARSLNTARGVRIGFLEGADYPEGDGGARLANAAKRLTAKQQADHPSWKRLLLAWSAWAASHPGGPSVAQVAFWNEFGTLTAKPRPFFRTAIRQHSGEWGAALARFLRQSKFDSAVALRKLGLLISEQVRESIMTYGGSNAPLTVHIKGFDRPLQDSETMARAVDFELVHR